METKNNEENGVLRERFALAMERIGEIAGEATVPEAYQPYFRRTAGFILTMEGLYGEDKKRSHRKVYTGRVADSELESLSGYSSGTL